MDHTPAQNQTARGERLVSWKEIAAYLKRDIRTVQRWEKQEALPVHRHLHDERGTAYAYAGESMNGCRIAVVATLRPQLPATRVVLNQSREPLGHL
jgi:hypothetical protein